MATEQRLIDANKLWNALPADDGLLMYQVKRAIRDTPTVDAVEVVRCKDCTHNRKAIDEKGWGIFCSIWGRGWHRVEPDDFCSYGERRTDNG